MKNLKKFKIDKSGKSEAFFLKKKYISIDKKTIDNLQKYSLKKKKDVRICLHSSKKESLQYMINSIIKKKKIRAHKHKKTLEIYKIIKGKLNVKFFKNNEKFNKEYFLENNKIEICKVNPNTFHITNPVGKSCVFIETRSGPFNKKDIKFTKNFFNF